MFFSIITPVYNGRVFIEEYLNCLKNQDYPSWEAIIVDDLSTDDTFHALTRLTKTDPRFIVIKNTNAETKKIATPYQARNLALEKVRGKFIVFLILMTCGCRIDFLDILLFCHKIKILMLSVIMFAAALGKIMFSVNQPPFLNPINCTFCQSYSHANGMYT